MGISGKRNVERLEVPQPYSLSYEGEDTDKVFRHLFTLKTHKACIITSKKQLFRLSSLWL